MMYLTMNGAEPAALVRAIDDEEIVSVDLSRRDSLDMPYDQGFLIVAVVMRDGQRYRDAISETGSISIWEGATR